MPAGSQADNYLEAAEEAVAAAQLQGPLNIINGLTDILVDTANMDAYIKGLPVLVVAGASNSAAGEAILPTEIVQLPKYDYSLGAFVDEDPYWHGKKVRDTHFSQSRLPDVGAQCEDAAGSGGALPRHEIASRR